MTATLRDASQALARDWMLKGTFPPLNPDDPEEIAERAVYARCARLLNDAIAAAPPEPGWAEGRDAAAKVVRAKALECEALAASALTAGTAYAMRVASGACQKAEIEVRALQPPSAPTQAPEALTYGVQPHHRSGKRTSREVCEALLGAVGVLGALEKKTNAEIGKLLLDHVWASEDALGTARELLISEAVSRLAPELDNDADKNAAFQSRPAPEAKTAESEVGWIVLRKGQPRRLAGNHVFNTEAQALRYLVAGRMDPVRVRITPEPEPAPVEPEETR